MAFSAVIFKINAARLAGGKVQNKDQAMSAYMLSCFSRVRLFATQWTVARQAPLPIGFFRQEYWSGWPFPFPGGLPDPGVEPRTPALQADSLPPESPGQIHQDISG